jgi:hypothetical protein
MPDIDTKVLIGAGVAALILLAGVFFIGRATAGGSDESIAEAQGQNAASTTAVVSADSAADGTSTTSSVPPTGDPSAALLDDPDRATDIPEYGTAEEREALLNALAEAGVGMGSRTTILFVADSVCYDLERLQAQERSPAFAVRVVWNETLADLDSTDAAAFGAVFNAAPFFICPESIEYATEVAYWLGI